MQLTINLRGDAVQKFHDIEPQPHLQTMPPWQLSAKIVSQITRIVPPPLLYENTLCLSDEGVVSMRDGKLYLMFRVGDTYPTGQVEDVNVEAYIYRWQEYRTAEGELIQYQVGTLLMSPKTPTLRYPSVVTHEICEGSPLESWTSQQGLRKDADAEVVVTVKGNLIGRTRLVTRTRVYPVMSGIKWGGTFVPILARGATPGTVHVDWSGFHLHVPNETAHRTLPRVQSHRDVRASAPSDVRPPAPPAGHSLPDTFGSPVFTGEVGGADAWERHRAGERAGPDAAPGGTGGTQFWDGGGGPPLGPAGLPSAARAGSFSSGALSGAAGAAAAAPRPGALVLAPLEGLGLFGRGSQQQQRDSSLGAGPESPTCVRASASSGSGEPGRQSGRLGGGSATHFGAQGGDEWHATRNLFDAIANMQERYAEEAEEATRADLLLQPHP
ncbi:hypothetical protein FOA52_016068 [Chlamydomonas sp. UWO 241]|nr:hypothetical protein FOA52_016068 [Chlamydomonas sp. UWO 241]